MRAARCTPKRTSPAAFSGAATDMVLRWHACFCSTPDEHVGTLAAICVSAPLSLKLFNKLKYLHYNYITILRRR